MEKHLIVSIIGNLILFFVAIFLVYYAVTRKGKKNKGKEGKISKRLLFAAFLIIIGICLNVYYIYEEEKEKKVEK